MGQLIELYTPDPSPALQSEIAQNCHLSYPRNLIEFFLWKIFYVYRLIKEFKQIFLLNLSFQNILLIYLILSNIYKRTTIKQGTKLIILPVFQNCPKSVRRFSRNTHATSPAMSCVPIAAHRRRVRGQNSHLPSTTWWWVLATQHSTPQSLQWNITDLAGRSSSIYFMFPGRAEYKSDSGSAAISC